MLKQINDLKKRLEILERGTAGGGSSSSGGGLVFKEIPSGLINGSNKTFTTSQAYVAGSLIVIKNTTALGASEATETTPASGIFDLVSAPATGDSVWVIYQIASTATSNADTVDNYHANATPTANNILVLDSSGKVPASALNVAGTALTSAPATDHTASGITAQLTAGVTMNFGDVGYIASTGKMALIDADAIANMNGLFMCVDATISADAVGNFMSIGFARDDTWNWTVGQPIYGTVTGTTGNTLSQTPPSGTDDVVQILGIATHADRMYFYPQLVQLELA